METLSILVMAWRDGGNPEAGGAEVFTHEVARRWVAKGHEVTLLTSRFSGANAEATHDGVRIMRDGGKYAVYRRARHAYRGRFRHSADVVLDEINTIPFGTPHFVDGRSLLFALIFQLAREYWSYETPFPLSAIGRYWLENRWLRAYRNVPTFTISQSTREDLLALGFGDVAVVPVGNSITRLDAAPRKEAEPTLIFVGRLKKAKLPDDALHAFAEVRNRLPNARLWVVGSGYLRASLERGAPPGTTFFGWVPQQTKIDLLSRAHVLLYPAVREGWGLSIIEANAVGTPAIGYEVNGVRDSIRNGDTGLCVPPGDVHKLAEQAVSLLTNQVEYDRMATNALHWAQSFDWDASAEQMLSRFRSSGASSSQPSSC